MYYNVTFKNKCPWCFITALYVAKASLFVNYYTQPSQRGWVLASYFLWDVIMTGRKTRALQVPAVVPYKAFKNFPKALYGTTGGTCSARVFRPVLFHSISWNIPLVTLFSWYTNGPLGDNNSRCLPARNDKYPYK